MIWYLKKTSFTWHTSVNKVTLETGWGNGYVAVPPTHPAYKNGLLYIDVQY